MKNKIREMYPINIADRNKSHHNQYLQSDDVGMGAHFQYINLSSHFLCHLHMFDFTLV